MFSFHKPRVYRSSEGCCICRAKSSSSRFTDSRKYESDSMKCFDLKYPRHGEICNACVLLVKRYKRLPVGSKRHWGHVVDARAGPGTKSFSKYKKYTRDYEVSENMTEQNGGGISSNNNSTKSLMSKIFKKNKKSNNAKKENTMKRNKLEQAWNENGTAVIDHSLPTTPDSLGVDSDYEDSLPAGVSTTASGATIVQFQTQTRASSYRSRNNATAVAASNLISTTSARKRKPLKMGSKRRKILAPKKHCHNGEQDWNDNGVQFLDDCEWQERKSCCGMVYECRTLGGALLIDLAHYKGCAEHDKKINTATLLMNAQKNIKATMPATLQISAASIGANGNSTPALKKHHLFYKRQSECFPGDVATTATATLLKTESNIHHNSTTNSSTNNISASLIPANITTTMISASTLQQTQQHLISRQSSPNIISPPLMVPTISHNKSQNFLHKIKADTTKIVKHSMEKLNTAVRIKTSDLHEMKQVIKTVDKSYVLSNNGKTIHNIPLSQQQQPHYITPLSAAALANSTSSSSSATKFSDNSSDSGFDENTLDRKSASPLQEDTERKLLTRPGVQTMFLASGVQIQGQQQNLVLTGNEVAAKMLQNRKQLGSAMTTVNNANQIYAQNTNRINTTSSAVKIAQIVGTGAAVAPTNTNSHSKMRAIYNNNTIQHENGVTTIVPASSLAAATQAAAMQHANIGPSTVTITPAPHHHHLPLSTTAKKVLPSPININSNITTTNTHLNTINSNVSSLNNQKIILVKTSTKYNTNVGAGSATLTPIGLHSGNNSSTTVSNAASTAVITNVCKNLT